MIVCFELTMPNVGSWNGKWTGADKRYYLFKTLRKSLGMAFMKLEDRRSWHYNFGDGWGANVSAVIVTSAEKKRRAKLSKGFCGYEWMVDSILKHDTIQADEVETQETDD
jgi:hypothetical protein